MVDLAAIQAFMQQQAAQILQLQAAVSELQAGEIARLRGKHWIIQPSGRCS